MTILTLCIATIVILTLSYRYFSRQGSLRTPAILSIVICSLSAGVWALTLDQSETLRTAKVAAEQKVAAEPKTVKELVEQVENQLRDDPNNSSLWYELGHGYMASSRFEEASVCFSYVLRLEEEPTASVFSAKATADYYVNSQRITDSVQQLLNQALLMDEYNYPALMLIGNDHFISFRYKDAITTWQKILDSERQGLDRTTVINSINRAKELL